VALADKLDTLRGCFRIGLAPTGSKDPFALRRAAQGVVKILVEGGIRIPLAPLIQDNEALTSFFEDRIRYYFRDIRGYPYDEVNAAMAGGWSELWDLAERLEAVHQVRPTDNFEPLAASFKRVRNILEQAEFAGGDIDPSLFVEEAERGLYAAMGGVQITGVDYETALLAIARLRPAIDTFFDKVLVNASDERVRNNRLALLHHLRSQFCRIADFSEIVTSNS
jgi:glycyl-tRNA synthetase beta chain